jgi:cell division septum initiation protein DivIVA
MSNKISEVVTKICEYLDSRETQYLQLKYQVESLRLSQENLYTQMLKSAERHEQELLSKFNFYAEDILKEIKNLKAEVAQIKEQLLSQETSLLDK